MAYYRKCIALKRRLTAVESANDQAKLRRVRLDRAVMKMRLERAYLLDELRRRMDLDVENSDGSDDEGMATPPQDRPQRDKRRKTGTAAGTPAAAGAKQENGSADDTQSQSQTQHQQQTPLPGNPYARQRREGSSHRSNGRDRSRGAGKDDGNAGGEDVEMGEEEGGEDGEEAVEAAAAAPKSRGGSRSRRGQVSEGARSSAGRSAGFAAVNGDD
jgi:hypothetical protein